MQGDGNEDWPRRAKQGDGGGSLPHPAPTEHERTPVPTDGFDSIRGFCLHVLESGDLSAKLTPPRSRSGEPLADLPGSAVFIDRPARLDHIQIRSGADRLPNLNELRDPHARSVCVERFANHELMAVELFAWVLLAYPGMASALRRGLLHVLEEEQSHVRLYLDRLRDLGSGLGQNALSDYFWQQVPSIHASRNGPASFLCVMGLTFEQANLDFSLLYRDAFRQNGDEPSALALDQVHHDEIGHVRLAARWLRKIGEDGETTAASGRAADLNEGDPRDIDSLPEPIVVPPPITSRDRDVELYERHIPFPLSAARAKGRRFDEAARRRAGLSRAFIEHVRAAKPYRPRPVGPADVPTRRDEPDRPDAGPES